jgi:nitrous oxidase accessory protein NosD
LLAAPCLSIGAATTWQDPPLVTPTAGMTIDRSVRVAPGRYRLEAPAGDAPALRIRGENITIDLTGVTLEGGDPFADPDSYRGTGVLVDGGRGVTMRGGAIRGFKTAVLARRSPSLHITGLDASYNWKPRLLSGVEKESLADWMSYHSNDKDEWLRYGAAIYLAECDDAEIDNSRAVQGQNGLMVTRSSRLKIWNNTFSWLSGVGLGLYRTTDSTVVHNKLDWDVRGYSHGFYYRGQDSTAILMYEQSSRNVIAYNSATHGGDGLFLWAGQATMDTGQGGANDNRFVENDFSHAVANGIETTFSRNQFIRNRVDDCWHGVWGGYSYNTSFLGNRFAGNDEAIAIEHGQDITIAGNTFNGDATAIRLWANVSQDPNWGYPKNRDTRSRDYRIEGNTFSGNKTALNVTRTLNARVWMNKYDKVGVPLQLGPDVSNLEFEPPPCLDCIEEVGLTVPRLPGGMDAMLPAGARRGRSTIIVDEWGPYDYRSPKIWPAGKTTDRPLKLRVLGPAGKWTLSSIRGGTISAKSGAVPGEVTVTPSGRGADLDLQLAYAGEAVVTPRGRSYPAGASVPFSYRLIGPAADWSVTWWTFDAASDPLTAPEAFAARLRGAPAKAERLPRLDFLSSRALSAGLPNDRVALRAEAVIRVPSGGYTLQVTSDDGVRVWVDGALVVDRWSVHETQVDRVALAAGARRIRIDYFEATGWAELQATFIKP